jgi:hypothetical protein
VDLDNHIVTEKASLNKIQEITSNIFSKKEIFSVIIYNYQNNPTSMNSSVLNDMKSNLDINIVRTIIN